MSDAGFVPLPRRSHGPARSKLGCRSSPTSRPATPEEIEAHLGVETGYCGPAPRHGKAHIQGKVLVVADRTAAAMADFICGANGIGLSRHRRQLERDCAEPDVVADIPTSSKATLYPTARERSSSVVASKWAMSLRWASVTRRRSAPAIDKDRKERVMEMGCYGIGVTRVVARRHRAEPRRRGIAWPVPMARSRRHLQRWAMTAVRGSGGGRQAA